MISRQVSRSIFQTATRFTTSTGLRANNNTQIIKGFQSALFHNTTASSSAVRKRRDEREALRDAFKLNLMGDDEEEVLSKRKRKSYEPNPEVPILDNLAARWEKMDSLDQEEIALYLEDRMRGDWKDLSELEKKSGMFFLFSYYY